MSTSNSPYQSNVTTWRGFETADFPDVPQWVETAGRAGHIAKGVVYSVVGMLAFGLAIGAGGETSGARGAITKIGEQPFGRLLLAVIAVGLAGYAVWRFIQAAKDTRGVGTDAKGLVKRTGYAISGVIYAFLGLYAAAKALGFGTSSSDGGTNGAASWLLDSMAGRVGLGIAGGIIIGVGIYFVYKAIRAKFMSNYDFTAMSEYVRKLALYAGRMGLSTRGIAFSIIGGFLISSAIQGTSGGDIAGLSDALAAIAAQAYGKILLGITGFGFICYGVHMALMGCFRRFNVT